MVKIIDLTKSKLSKRLVLVNAESDYKTISPIPSPLTGEGKDGGEKHQDACNSTISGIPIFMGQANMVVEVHL